MSKSEKNDQRTYNSLTDHAASFVNIPIKEIEFDEELIKKYTSSGNFKDI